MKKAMRYYENYRLTVLVAFLGAIFLSIGFFIKSDSINLFYTFHSNIILFLGEFFFEIGELIIMNMPLIYMLNSVCKRDNSSSTIILALIGYFTLIVTTMLFASQNLNPNIYTKGYGVNSLFNSINSSRLPIEMGFVGCLLVVVSTKLSFILSRKNFGRDFISVQIKGIIYNVLFCFILGVLVAYCLPALDTAFSKLINFITSDLLDPLRIGIYSILDRVLSVLGLTELIRQPFWYSSLGGSYTDVVNGVTILGDVNIWNYLKTNGLDFISGGRFTVQYYVINIFMIPAMYLGTTLSITDKRVKTRVAFVAVLGSLFSMLAGNPLPCEMMMIMVSPLLYVFYLLTVGISTGILTYYKASLGFTPLSNNTLTATPGNFPDFIVNIRNSELAFSLSKIFYVGIFAFMLMLVFTIIYYRHIAYDFTNSGTLEKNAKKIVEAVGGKDNIIKATCGFLRTYVYLENPENIDIAKITDLGCARIRERKDGIDLLTGSSAYRISQQINYEISRDKSI